MGVVDRYGLILKLLYKVHGTDVADSNALSVAIFE